MFLTVTEVRYVPIPAPATATAAPVATIRPAYVKPELDHSASTTIPSAPAASPISTWSSVADKATPATAVATSTHVSSRSKEDESTTVSEEKTDITTTTTTSIDVTISTTTTTQGSTTRTTTSVGTDGTTTVLTEYPTTTRQRGPQNTSGAQTRGRGQFVSSPSLRSTFEYLTGCAILGPAWLVLAITTVLAAGCPLLRWV
ncbi:hypothetical protein EC968_001215 [Mortierella alpina]|nr:hypothetical protein EC968_001215 [Mortierella alpina]